MDGVGAPQSQSAAATTISSAEEQALKRNTDCVYFLASPLTCKKGSECEYRHSDVARVNPRDCWFWLNGNCLNPKCGFRHPPLDGLLGSPVSNPGGSTLHQAQNTSSASGAYTPNSNKQGVPCIFFQKGFCLKGDRCPFLHAPNPAGNKSLQVTATSSGTEPQSLKKTFGGNVKSSQEQKFVQKNTSNSLELHSQAKHVVKVEALTKNSVSEDRNFVGSASSDDELNRYRPMNVTATVNGNIGSSRSSRLHQLNLSDDPGILSGKDADELSREPSPGFDVLVDDEHGDSDYYHDEEQFRGSRGHEGTYLNSMNEYDVGHSAEYGAMVDVDQDIYHDSRGYDSYEHMHGQYGRERHRSSSAQPERRQYYAGGKSSDQIADLDLRHHLSKKRRANGLRSVISNDYPREDYADDRSYRGPPQRESHDATAHESSFSSRLQGRIKMLGRSSSPVSGNDLPSDRELDRGRNQKRSSPGRLPLHLGRLRDRIRGRIQEDSSNEGRNPRVVRQRNENAYFNSSNNTDFTGPKSLAELKSGKNDVFIEGHGGDPKLLPIGKRKHHGLENHQHSESDLSFEGPKPLSEILKRKRAASQSGLIPENNGNNNMSARKTLMKSTINSETRVIGASESKESGVGTVHSSVAEPKFENASKVGADDVLVNREKVTDVETEDPMRLEDAAYDQGAEAYDNDDGYYDGYEPVEEGEEIENLEDGVNAEDEYYEEDEGDDFAKKMGVVYS